MSRSRCFAVGLLLAVGAVGCAHCDTCDDFPTPCIGGNCGGGSAFMPGMAMAPTSAEGAPATSAPGSTTPAPGSQPGPFSTPTDSDSRTGGAAPADSPPASPAVNAPGPNG
jgi:hypothetical protein